MRQVLFAAALALAAGCGSGTDGAVQVSGKVTFKGQPVPHGRVYFDPDPKNPGGQQGYADIADGRFDTAKGGKPPSAGAVTARVEGLTPPGPGGAQSLLFVPHEFKLELPAGKTEKDFDVPATAADRLPKNAERP